jgi:membrane-bound lytic murein transglycosylase D
MQLFRKNREGSLPAGHECLFLPLDKYALTSKSMNKMKCMMNRIAGLLPLCLFAIALLLAGFRGNVQAQGQNVPDTNFLADNPFAARLDSLAGLAFFNSEKARSRINKPNKYGFPSDSVPVYCDSVYRMRIEYLNTISPFEFVYNEQVKAYIEYFGVKKRRFLERVLGLAELYFPLFEEQLDIHDLPMELKNLAIIESALNPVARSRAGASGIWQFMLNTGKMYGLQVSSYVDDRFDPYKSTVAACRHLKDLHNIYNDWAIVLAAYNAGSGTINRAIRSANLGSGQHISYWTIRRFLPRETQNYVPSFIAVTYLMKYSEEHNLYPVAPDFFFSQIDTVFIDQSVTFDQISAYLCIPVEQVQFLNPAYKKGVIPATDRNKYVLRLPREFMADFHNNKHAVYTYKSEKELEAEKARELASTAKTTTTTTTAAPSNKSASSPQTASKYVYHTVQKGDSLWSIANRYSGVTVEDIRKLNNLTKSSMIHPGQKLKVSLKG